MIKLDRTVKWLLAVIAALLTVIAFRPMVPLLPRAEAQTQAKTQAQLRDSIAQTTTDSTVLEVGYKIPQPSVITVPTGQYVREMQVMDAAKCFRQATIGSPASSTVQQRLQQSGTNLTVE